MAMLSSHFSPIGCPLVAAGFSSAPSLTTSICSAQLSPASPPHSPISRPLSITHKLIASHCPLLSHGSFLLFGSASPALWALLPTSSVAFASEQIVESAQTAVGTVESGGTGLGTEPENINWVVTILGTSAFVGLVLLTIGVIYLAVSDFLDKRARDEEGKKITTESTTKKKQKGSVAATRGSAKGFGKKPQDEE